jgi:Spy/CpxP family protein refolding chaperone
MKTNWLKRTLVSVAACAALAGSIAAHSQNAPHEGFGHRGPPTPEQVAAHEAHILDRIGKSLALDAGQAAKLKVLADTLEAQRPAPPAPGSAGDPRQRLESLIAGRTFDRAGAQRIADEHVARIQASVPALIKAAGDFFDSLNPTQQQLVRNYAERHHGFMGLGGHGPRGRGGFGEHDGWHGHEGHGDRDGHPGGPADPAGHGTPPAPGN